jgi:hydroxymethylbilane synthase
VVRRFGIGEHEIVVYDTSGDIDKDTPIAEVEGTDFFTDRIERALLKKEIDLAVHSAKDLPARIPEGLMIVATTESIDKDDVLVSKGNLKLSELPAGAKVGTSSRRRKESLLMLRSDLKLIDLRGNIEERMEKLNRGEYDAIVIAAAGLIRLGLEHRIAERLPFETAPGQGALALEIRKEDKELYAWLKARFIS